MEANMNNHNWTDNADNANLTDNSNPVGEASSSNATGNLDDINMAVSPDFTVEANLTNPSSAISPGNPDTACSSDQSAVAHLAPNTASNLYNPKKANNTGCDIRNDQEVRMVMVGKTGTGKSATGNTILGRQCFESRMAAKSLTFECAKGRAMVDGQKVAVIDSPGLFDTRYDIERTTKDICQCISYASPGPHVFLVVIRLGRFTNEEKETVQKIQEIFGQAADTFSMVLFTGGDLLEGTIEEFVAESPELKELVARCNGQYHVFNNTSKDRGQVKELLQKIRNIVQRNGGSHYTNEMFQQAERAIEEKKEQILREKQEKTRRNREEIEKELYKKYIKKINQIQEGFIAQNERIKHERDVEKKREKEMHDAEKEKERKEDEEKLEELKEKMKKEYLDELTKAREEFDKKEKARAREAAEMFNPLLALVKAGKVLIRAGAKLAEEIRKLGEKIGILGTSTE